MFVTASAAEQAIVTQWFEKAFSPPATIEGSQFPVSFRYGDQPSAELVPAWECVYEDQAGEAFDRRVLTFTDAATGLEMRVEIRRFANYPAVDWVVYFRNTAAVDTPILADIEALDASFALPGDRTARVHHARGSNCGIDDFEPLVDALNPTPLHPQGGWTRAGNPLVVASRGGRSSDSALPFFRLEMDGAPGVMGAVGWTGDVLMRFWRGDGDAVRVQAGMRRTHLKLLPGEEIRTPRVLLVFFDGDGLRGHNLLRRIILEHYAPRHEGELLQTPISLACWGENRAERQIAKIRWLAENGIAVDNYWVDAGWHGDAPYKDSSNVFNSSWGGNVGNWYPNKAPYPDGMGPVGEAAQAAGMEFTLWLEPERVCPDTQIAREHPDWLLGPIGGNYLFNLGDPEACAGLVELVGQVLEDGKVTVYRQDFNMDPAPFWEAADAPDRVGMAEIRHIEGLYRYWDALRERIPGLLIDNCSSGGRRIDLETLSRSIPLWQSDFQCFLGFDPIGLQGQTHGLSMWVPLHSGACDRPEDYALRSAIGPGLVFCTPPNFEGTPEGYLTPWDAFSAEWFRKAAGEQKVVRPYYQGDFYPLLSYTLADDAWAAWQCDRPDLGEGCVMALRRPRSPFGSVTPKLHGLEAEAAYELRDADTGTSWQSTGQELMRSGLNLSIDVAPGSRLVLYRRMEG